MVVKILNKNNTNLIILTNPEEVTKVIMDKDTMDEFKNGMLLNSNLH
jgi:hypothetical protein